MRVSARLIPAALALGAVTAVQALRRDEPWDLSGRAALITGGSRGLGLLIARLLAADGAQLTLVARDETELERARRDLEARGAHVLVVAADVGDRAQMERAVQRAVERFGRLDILVHNAGIIQVGPFEHMELQDFEQAMNVHFWAALYAIRAAVPQMRRQGGGRIVNISSIGGKVAIPHLTPYSASKFALSGLSDGVRAELARDKIRVTSVYPGLMRTGSHLNAQFKGRQREEFTAFALVGALPIASIDGERAARQIVDAMRTGKAELTISTQARTLVLLNALVPNLLAPLFALVARFLPGPTGRTGDQSKSGWESRTPLAPSPITRLADRATVANNELRGHQPPV